MQVQASCRRPLGGSIFFSGFTLCVGFWHTEAAFLLEVPTLTNLEFDRCLLVSWMLWGKSSPKLTVSQLTPKVKPY